MRVFNPTKCCDGGGGPTPPPDVVNAPLTKDVLVVGSVQLHDPVYLVGVNEVSSTITNEVPSPIVGILIQQLDVNRWKMLITGNLFYNVQNYGLIYLGSNGKISPARPSAGTVQRLGFSYGDGTVFINLELQQSYARTS